MFCDKKAEKWAKSRVQDKVTAKSTLVLEIQILL